MLTNTLSVARGIEAILDWTSVAQFAEMLNDSVSPLPLAPFLEGRKLACR